MTLTDRLDAKLEDLEARGGYFVGKHGAKYVQIYNRIWWVRYHPDACAEPGHRAGCGNRHDSQAVH